MLIYNKANIEDRNYEVVMLRDDYESQRVEIITWLIDNYGYDEDSGLWDLWEWNELAYFSFHREVDAMAFKLRWI